MTRTWDENRTAINQLWPMAKFTDEERRLWHDDLAGLDQATLYDALRETKRTRDSLYPQLKWVLDSYRDLTAARKKAVRPAKREEFARLNLRIDPDVDARLAEELAAFVDVSTAADFAHVERVIFDKLPEMHSRTALRVLCYARRRLLGEVPRFGRVTPAGDVAPFFSAETPARAPGVAQEARAGVSTAGDTVVGASGPEIERYEF